MSDKIVTNNVQMLLFVYQCNWI